MLKDEIVIFESAYFQHNIHDLMLTHCKDRAFILSHLAALFNAMEELNPILLYLTQDSVRETLIEVVKKRENGSRLVRSIEKSVYGKTHQLQGLDGAATFWEIRKEIELEAIRKNPINAHFIDNSDYVIENLFHSIVSVINPLLNMGCKNN